MKYKDGTEIISKVNFLEVCRVGDKGKILKPSSTTDWYTVLFYKSRENLNLSDKYFSVADLQLEFEF